MGDLGPIHVFIRWTDWALPLRVGFDTFGGRTEIAVSVLCVTFSIVPALFWEKPQ